MKLSDLKLLYYVVFNFEFENKNILVCRSKKTQEPEYFSENNGEYFLLDNETNEKVKNFVERPESDVLYKIDGTTEVEYNVRSLKVPQMQSFVEYRNDDYMFSYIDVDGWTKSIKFPFIFRVEKELSEENFKRLYTYALEDISSQLQKFIDCGVAVEELLERYKDKPLSINYFDFAKSEKIKKNTVGYVNSEHREDTYLNTNRFGTTYPNTDNPVERTIYQKAVSSEVRNTFKHEFSHSISCKKDNVSGIMKSHIIFVGLNEALTEIAALDLNDNRGRFRSSYGEYARLTLISLPDRKEALRCYAYNDLDGLVDMYAKYYFCTESEVMEFFYKIDYLHHFGGIQDPIIYDNLLKDVKENLVGFFIKREIAINGKLALPKIDWRKHNIDFVDSVAYYGCVNPKEIFKKIVLTDIASYGTKIPGKVIYGGNVYSKAMITRIANENHITLEQKETKTSNGSAIQEFYDKVYESEKYKNDEDLGDSNILEEHKKMIFDLPSFDEKIVLAKSVGSQTLVEVICDQIQKGCTEIQKNIITRLVLTQDLLNVVLKEEKSDSLKNAEKIICNFIIERSKNSYIIEYIDNLSNAIQNCFINLCAKNPILSDMMRELVVVRNAYSWYRDYELFFKELRKSKDENFWDCFNIIMKKSELKVENRELYFQVGELLKYATHSNRAFVIRNLVAYSNLNPIKDMLMIGLNKKRNKENDYLTPLIDELIGIVYTYEGFTKMPAYENKDIKLNDKYYEMIKNQLYKLMKDKPAFDAVDSMIFVTENTNNKYGDRITTFKPSILFNVLANEKGAKVEKYRQDILTELKIKSCVNPVSYKEVYEKVVSIFDKKSEFNLNQHDEQTKENIADLPQNKKNNNEQGE